MILDGHLIRLRIRDAGLPARWHTHLLRQDDGTLERIASELQRWPNRGPAQAYAVLHTEMSWLAYDTVRYLCRALEFRDARSPKHAMGAANARAGPKCRAGHEGLGEVNGSYGIMLDEDKMDEIGERDDVLSGWEW